MIEALPDMPPGTMGFKATGKLTHEDYEKVAIPPMRAAVDRGEKIRMLFQIGPEFHGMKAEAIWDELKADFGLGLGHMKSWERMAVVSDADWMRHAMSAFGWMFPGEVKLFELDDLDDAKEWLVDDD